MIKSLLKYSLLLLVSLLACKKPVDSPNPNDNKDPIDETPISNSDVNNWIHAKMNEFYLWEDEMKSVPQTDLTLEPDAYFESLLVEPGETDRFSWIQESADELRNSLAGVTTTFGLKYSPVYSDASRTRVVFPVSYPLKGGVAERMGILRGDVITKVDGQDITLENYRSVFSPETVTVTLGDYVAGAIVDTEKTVELTKEVTQANALQFSSVIEFEDKKIGYFVYTQFITSTNHDLNNMFANFKSVGIDELVVDLRFNPGGYFSSQELLSSLIVKDLDENKLMSYQVWNAEQTKKYTEQNGDDVFNSYFFKNKSGIGELNNTGTLNRVYFLVSNGSASASESLIASLKPYMDVVLVGQHTYGKNVGSITIDDDDERWAWGMQPIVLKTYDSNGNSDWGTKDGFAPDFEKSDNTVPFKAFGDPEETLLKIALEDILGSDVLAKARKGVKIKPSSEFELLLNEHISDNPLMNRKEMWVTGFPGE